MSRIRRLAEMSFMLLVLFGPIGFSLAFLHLIGHYLAYFDIGINATTRLFTLVLFYAPAAFAFFYIGTGVAAYVIRRTNLSEWAAVACLIVTMVALFDAAFRLELWLTRDYPSMPGTSLSGFLTEYVTGWYDYLARLLH